MKKLLGSNPISIITTLTGIGAVVFPLIEQYKAGTLSAWMLAAGLSFAVFARFTDENWTSSINKPWGRD
jgi:hypothetical protein